MSGLSVGMFLFLVSVGMSLIFGVTRIVNLAHGCFYMVAHLRREAFMPAPTVAVALGMDADVLTTAFVVVVIGGLGSFAGSFISALLVGLLQSFGILIFPAVSIVLLFALMAVVLIVRPWGLLGRPEA